MIFNWQEYRVAEDGSVSFPGVDYGGLATIIASTTGFMALKFPAHRCWISMMEPRRYISPYVRFYHIRTKSGKTEALLLMEWEVTKKRKEVRA